MLLELLWGHLSSNFVYRQPKLIENQNVKVQEQAIHVLKAKPVVKTSLAEQISLAGTQGEKTGLLHLEEGTGSSGGLEKCCEVIQGGN